MNNTIYISGPISDPTTSQPRTGWQKEFLEAEAKLRRMGFSVMNPVDIAREVEDAFRWRYSHFGGPCSSDGEPKPMRADYIMACLQRMKMAQEADMLHGVYLIGDIDACKESHGVQMELHLAEILGIPVFAEFRADNEIWTDSFYLKSERTIEGLLEDKA